VSGSPGTKRNAPRTIAVISSRRLRAVSLAPKRKGVRFLVFIAEGRSHDHDLDRQHVVRGVDLDRLGAELGLISLISLLMALISSLSVPISVLP